MKSISIICNKNGTCSKPNTNMLYFNNENDITTLNIIFPEASTPVARWMLVETISGSGDIFLGYGDNILFSLTYSYMISGKLRIQPYTIGTIGATPTREYWQETSFDIYSTLNGGTLPTIMPDIVAQLQSQISDLQSVKMDKIINGTENNFTTIDNIGNTKDSGYKNSDYVHIQGNENIIGTKTFEELPILQSSTPTLGNQATTKDYVDNTIEIISNGDIRTINNISSISHNFGIDSDSNNLTINPKLGAIGIEVDGYTVVEANNLLADKVDKVIGKELSTNDFTDILKTKLDGIASGAEVNVNADWNATSGDAQILNKPFIPTALSDLTQDTTHRTVTDIEKSTWNAKQDALGYTAENTLNKGNSNGYASLDINSKIPLNQIPDSILGQIHYKGTWDASSGIFPTPATLGDYYIVSVAGIISLIDYQVGDWIVYNGSTWDKIDNTESVSLVNGQKGIVVLTTNDINDYLNKRYVTDAQKLLFSNIDQDVKISATPTFSGLILNGLTQINTPNATTKGLIIKGFTSQTANLQEWQNSAGAVITSINSGGTLVAAANIYSPQVSNPGDKENSNIQLTNNGAIIYRNKADTNTALIVNQVNASSTGHILDFQFGGVNQSFISKDGIYYGMGLSNLNTSTNANLSLSNNGIVISRNIADANNALTVNLINASSTGLIADFQFGGSSRVYIASNGNLACNTVDNTTNSNYARLYLASNGPIISRNVADANTILTVQNLHASGTGRLLELKDSAGTVRYAVDPYGAQLGEYFQNLSSGSNSKMQLGNNGTIINRNIGDANTCLIVNQVHASSTGYITDFQFGGVSKVVIDKGGIIYATSLSNISNITNSKIDLTANGTIISRNIADANSALIINQINTSSTGNVIDCQVAGVSKFYVTKTGIAVHGTTAVQDGGIYYASTNNAYVNVTNNGTIISRNVGDGNTCLTVNQIHASSTGKIADFQFGSTSQAYITTSGTLVGNLFYGYGMFNKVDSANSRIDLNSTGSVISRNIADASSCLIVNQINTSSTGYIADFQFGGVDKAFISVSGNYYGAGLANASSSANAYIAMTSSGATVSHNIADANAALVINQIHASSTGAILSLQSESVQKAYITKSGTLATPKISNLTTENNSAIFVNDTGLLISRNIADANPALIVNQVQGTGYILNLQFGGVLKAYISASGVGGFNGGVATTIINNTNYGATYGKIDLSTNTGTVISRDVADASPCLIVNQINASSTGLVQEWKFNNTQVAQINTTGTFRSSDYANITNANNSYMQLGANGTLIRRNIADSNPVLQVKNLHASSTGDVIQFINTSAIVGTYVKSTGALGIKNDLYIVGKDSSGALELNMFKTNTSNQIETGADLVLGTIEAEQDSGAITLFNMPVSAVTAGTEMSSTFKIGGTNILKVYAEADGAGSVQNTKIITPRAIIGTSINNTTFEPDGTLVLNGAATVYNDLMTSVINLRGGVTPPTFAVFQNGVYANRFDDANTHIVYGSVEIQHDYKEGTDLEVHIHWSPSTTNTGNARFTFEYTVSNMSTGTFGATTTLAQVQAGSGTINKHQYLSIGVISGTGRKIGDVIAFALTRTGSDVLDTFTGNAFIHQLGVHYECDAMGSRTQTGK